MPLRRHTLAHEDGFAVLDVVCTEPSCGWSEPEPCTQYILVFPRRGAFVRRGGRHERLMDPGVAYFERPGVLQQIAHPGPGGDACTALSLAEESIAELAGGEPR